MSLLRFHRETETARFHDPLRGMELTDHPVEIRRDPLTGATAVTSPDLATKAEMFFGVTDWELAEEVARRTRQGCFFCPEKVEEMTPRYPEELVSGGRIRRGEALLFPNLFPLAAVHAVVCWPAHHSLRPSQFTPALLADALGCAVSLAGRLREAPSSPRHLSLCCNHMAPAGASLAHPHVQLYGGGPEPAALARLWELSRDFLRKHGRSYWEVLVEEESRQGERFIACEEGWTWLAPFAPTGGREIWAVLPGGRGLADLTEGEQQALARGLHRVLGWYERAELSAFNFSLLAGPQDAEGTAGFPLVLQVIARSAFQAEYRCDDYFLQRQLGRELLIDPPEKMARELRERWGPEPAPSAPAGTPASP